MSKTSTTNSSGESARPVLGKGKPFGHAQPGGSRNKVPAASDFSSVGKPARPGAQTKGPASPGSPPKVARPGGKQSANR